MLLNIPEERRSPLHHGRGLKSRVFKAFFLLGLLDREEQDITSLRNVGNHLQPTRRNILVGSKMWYRQMSHNCNILRQTTFLQYVIFRNISLCISDSVVKFPLPTPQNKERHYLSYPQPQHPRTVFRITVQFNNSYIHSPTSINSKTLLCVTTKLVPWKRL